MHCYLTVIFLLTRTSNLLLQSGFWNGITPPQGQVFAFAFVAFMRACQPTSWACPGPSEWCPDIWCDNHPPGFLLSENSDPIIHTINEVLASNVPQCIPCIPIPSWNTCGFNGWTLSWLWGADHKPQMFSQLSFHLTVSFSGSCFISLSMRMFWETVTKALLKSKQTT